MAILRAATPGDLAPILTLWRRPENRPFLTPPDADDLSARMAQGALLVWVEEARLLGFAALTEWVPGSYGISEMAVAEPGQGHGRRMLQALIDHVFSDASVNRLGLDATIDNHPALRLYRQVGFVQEGIFRECWQRDDGHWVDCVFLSMLRREWAARSRL